MKVVGLMDAISETFQFDSLLNRFVAAPDTAGNRFIR